MGNTENTKNIVEVYTIDVILKNGKTMNTIGRFFELPKELTLAELAHNIKHNGEVESVYITMGKVQEIPEEARLGTAELSLSTTRNVPTQDRIESRNIPELPGEEKKKKNFFPLLIVPLLIGNYFIDNVVCTHENVTIDKETIAITIEDERNPGIEYGALNSYAGQEEMTDRFVAGDGREAYSCQKQADEERVSVETHNAYGETTAIINAAIAVIGNPNSTQSEIEQAIGEIEEQLGVRISIREAIKSGIEENAERFKVATDAHPDDRSEDEKEIVDDIVEDFNKNTEADKADMAEVQGLKGKIQKGEKLEAWRVNKNEDGDYVITAQQVTEVVEEVSHTGVEAFRHNLQRWLDKFLPKQKEGNQQKLSVKNSNVEISRVEGDER